MNKNYNISQSCSRFIDFAKEVLLEMSVDERKNLKYLDLVKKTSDKYYQEAFNDSFRKSSYRFFRQYYCGHQQIINETKKPKKSSGEKITIDDILELLLNDIREELLLKALSENAKAFDFNQEGFSSKDKKFFLLLEDAPDLIEKISDIIIESYSDLIDSIFNGYGGLLIAFSNKEDLTTFKKYIKK